MVAVAAVAALVAGVWMIPGEIWFLLGLPGGASGQQVVAPPALVSAAAVPAATVDEKESIASAADKRAAENASKKSSLATRPLSAWLADVAGDAGRDLVLSPELRGDLTASESVGLSWEQRLDAYARVFGFDYEVGPGLIEVTRPGQGGASLKNDEAPPVAAEAVPVAAEPEPEPSPQTRVVRLAHESAKEAASVLARAGKALDVTVSADLSSNALVLSGQPAALHRVSAVIDELDKPRRRILLDVKMVEVLRSARLDLGVEWKVTGSTVGGDVSFPPPATDAGSAALLIATHGATALDARISALAANGKLRVVSRPSVVMVEGSPATIESVRILRIRLPSNGTVVGDEVTTGASAGRATEDIPVGVRLEVTPAIRGGGRVLLRVRAKSSSLGQPLPPDNIPEELSRMVDAEVFVTSGETAVLGGLSRESGGNGGAGVPGLRRVPLLGALFGRKTRTSEEEELVVLVTPRVLD